MSDLEFLLPRPVRWLLDRGWEWFAGRVLPEAEASLYHFDDETEELAA